MYVSTRRGIIERRFFMKRSLSMILVFVAVFAFASCKDKKSSEKEKEIDVSETETVQEKIPAEEGGKIENSDGSISIEIPGGALDTDTMVTMTIYNTPNLFPTKKGEKIISRIVEFEPSGTIFKKPVVISMKSLETVENKIITAAVYHTAEETWSYSEDAAVKFSGYDDTGDPIMTTATGDPIMLNDTGDPIMMNATGDPIMLAATGDPIMMTATGDPIMMTATGDPIMMTTGHFTAYAFISVDQKEAVEEPDDDDTENDDEISDTDTPGDDEPAENDDDEADTGIIEDDDPADDGDTDTGTPEPELPKSRVVCTGMTICTDDYGYQILCPEEGGDFYGQDPQYALRGSCVSNHKLENVVKPEAVENDFLEIKDNATGITWLYLGVKGTYNYVKDICGSFSYGGKEDWRLPTPKELMTLAQNDKLSHKWGVDPMAFGPIIDEGSSGEYGIYVWSSVENYVYALQYGEFIPPKVYKSSPASFDSGILMCVSGKEYGKSRASNYLTVTGNGDETVFDSDMNLYWQKNPVQAESWRDALAYCEDLEYAGASDWRLPNKNELLTLVDYMKAGTGVASSFPGMAHSPSPVFWSSTSDWTWNNAGIFKWVVDMRDGTAYTVDDSGYVGGFYNGNVTLSSAPSVVCVRSYLDAKTDFPVCNGTGAAPCKDANGTIWSPVIYSDRFRGFDFDKYGDREYGSVFMDLNYFSDICNNLNEKGSRKWRLPTIDEIRSILTSEKIKTGGSCEVTDECFTYDCYNADKCGDNEPSQTLFHDYGFMISGTFSFNEYLHSYSQIWAVYLPGWLEDEFFYDNESIADFVQRCVLDDDIKFEEAPYADPATGLVWSDISQDYLNMENAVKYCNSLSAGDSDHWWRVPTTDELKTLVINCDGDGDPCPVDVSGKHSPFRDTDQLLAVAIEDEEKNGIIDFTNGDIYINTSLTGKVRCVSDGGTPCAGNPCRWVAHSDGICNTAEINGLQTYKCGCQDPYKWNGSECASICNSDPCAAVQHSTGLCRPLTETTFECACATNYYWNGSECLNPCADNPCEDPSRNSTGECMPLSETEFECSCEEYYVWDGEECEEQS